MVEKILKALFDDAYEKGYQAGVNAERLVKEEDYARRMGECYDYGYIKGKEDTLAEIGEIDLDGLEDILNDNEIN